jgi:hypothetical protein
MIWLTSGVVNPGATIEGVLIKQTPACYSAAGSSITGER